MRDVQWVGRALSNNEDPRMRGSSNIQPTMIQRYDESNLPDWTVFESSFNQLDALLDADADAQTIANFLETIPLFNFHLVSRGVDQSIPLFRARMPEKDFDLVSTYSLPPPDKCKQNRANREGVPVFYASTFQPDTAIQEFLYAQGSSEATPTVFVSEWRLLRPINVKQVLSSPETLRTDYLSPFYSDLWSRTNEMFQGYSSQGQETLKKLASRLGDYFLRETDHRVSSEIAHQALLPSDAEDELRIDAIAYPSRVKKHGAMNIALSATCAKENVALVRVLKVQVTHWDLYGSEVTIEAIGLPRGTQIRWFRPRLKPEAAKVVRTSISGTTAVKGKVKNILIDGVDFQVGDLLKKLWTEKQHEVLNNVLTRLLNFPDEETHVVHIPIIMKDRSIVVNGSPIEAIELKYSIECNLSLVPEEV